MTRTAVAMHDDMTLREAIYWRRTQVACACIGGPMCCLRVYEQAERLHRAGHIVVKLIADAVRLDRGQGRAD